MTVGSQIELEWGGALRRFALTNAALRALQDRAHVDGGPKVMLERFAAAAGVVLAVRDTLKLSLIAAGETPDKAEEIVAAEVDRFVGATMVARGVIIAWSEAVAAALNETRVVGRDKADDGKQDDDATGKIDFGNWLGAATAAGIQKSEFDAMDFAELLFAIDGWRKVYGAPEEPDAPTREEHDALSADIDAAIARMNGHG